MEFPKLQALTEAKNTSYQKAQKYISWAMSGKKGTPSSFNKVTPEDIRKFFNDDSLDIDAIYSEYKNAMVRPKTLAVSLKTKD